jgi:hypothetical protein
VDSVSAETSKIENDSAQMELPGMGTSSDATDIIIEFLNKIDIPYVDNRNENGRFWIVGGDEIASAITLCESLGTKFTFAADGSEATQNKPGWYSCT